MLLIRRQPDKPAAAANKFCSIRTPNGIYTEFGIDPALSVYGAEISYQQHPKQHFRLYCRSAIVRAIQRCAQLVYEAEVHCVFHLAQKVILRHQLFQYHYLHLLLFPSLLSEHIVHRH